MDAMKPGRRILALLVIAAAACAGTALAAVSPTVPAGAQELLARHAALAPQLTDNAFGRPLVLQSREAARQVGGDVYAVIDYPFATVKQAFANAGTWCEVLILHLNTKQCRADAGDTLSVRVGRKGADADDAF